MHCDEKYYDNINLCSDTEFPNNIHKVVQIHVENKILLYILYNKTGVEL